MEQLLQMFLESQKLQIVGGISGISILLLQLIKLEKLKKFVEKAGEFCGEWSWKLVVKWINKMPKMFKENFLGTFIMLVITFFKAWGNELDFEELVEKEWRSKK